MTQENILTQKINQALQQGRKALVPFVPAGFPDRDSFWDIILDLDKAGADIIEIGVPFSDPVADGPVVENASIRCLKQGVNLAWIIDGLLEYRKRISSGIVLMGYFNPFLQFGIEHLAKQGSKAGVNGLIIPDLILEEALPYINTLQEKDMALVPLVGLNTPKERMIQYAEKNPAFVYLVAVLGITGTKAGATELLRKKLQEARESFDCPTALGFGLSARSQLDTIEDLVDAVVFGSALIEHIDSGMSVIDFMAGWK